jgi:SRSO17 transposase
VSTSIHDEWASDLDEWLRPFRLRFRHIAQQRWVRPYLIGLLGPGERKSVEPMAERVAPGEKEQLHHFVATSKWETGPIEDELLLHADALLGGEDAYLVIDDTGIPKKGEHSVGVAHQYCGQVGKQANSQCMVSVTLARNEQPLPVALRLYLPKEWTDDRERCRKVGVPDEIEFRTKWQIALDEIDRILKRKLRFGVVLADAGYGACSEFRKGLSARGLRWAVGISPEMVMYSAGVDVVMPPARPTGRPRKHGVPSERALPARAIIDALPKRAFKRIAWRIGTKGELAAEFAAVRVRASDGDLIARNRHLPGDEAWLVCERRSGGELKFHLTNHPADAPLKTIAADIKARWSCELAHQQLKQELGLGHFEGRSWHGLHHHAVLSMVAFAFLQHVRTKENKA